ncbi:MAG: hypothetical protein Q9181_007434 [Wetmoreana brouardii]
MMNANSKDRNALEALSKPKPDIWFAFPIDVTEHLELDYSSADLSFHILKELEDKIKLFSCPLTSLAHFKREVELPGPDLIDDKLVCYPFVIVEIKKDNRNERNKCYCQAANGCSASLSLLESLTKQYGQTHSRDDVRPIVAFTFVGPAVKLWLAYTKELRTKNSWERPWTSKHCIWEGSLDTLLDVVQLCRILDNILWWALRKHRVWLINQLQVCIYLAQTNRCNRSLSTGSVSSYATERSRPVPQRRIASASKVKDVQPHSEAAASPESPTRILPNMLSSRTLDMADFKPVSDASQGHSRRSNKKKHRSKSTVHRSFPSSSHAPFDAIRDTKNLTTSHDRTLSAGSDEDDQIPSEQDVSHSNEEERHYASTDGPESSSNSARNDDVSPDPYLSPLVAASRTDSRAPIDDTPTRSPRPSHTDRPPNKDQIILKIEAPNGKKYRLVRDPDEYETSQDGIFIIKKSKKTRLLALPRRLPAKQVQKDTTKDVMVEFLDDSHSESGTDVHESTEQNVCATVPKLTHDNVSLDDIHGGILAFNSKYGSAKRSPPQIDGSSPIHVATKSAVSAGLRSPFASETSQGSTSRASPPSSVARKDKARRNLFNSSAFGQLPTRDEQRLVEQDSSVSPPSHVASIDEAGRDPFICGAFGNLSIQDEQRPAEQSSSGSGRSTGDRTPRRTARSPAGFLDFGRSEDTPTKEGRGFSGFGTSEHNLGKNTRGFLGLGTSNHTPTENTGPSAGFPAFGNLLSKRSSNPGASERQSSVRSPLESTRAASQTSSPTAPGSTQGNKVLMLGPIGGPDFLMRLPPEKWRRTPSDDVIFLGIRRKLHRYLLLIESRENENRPLRFPTRFRALEDRGNGSVNRIYVKTADYKEEYEEGSDAFYEDTDDDHASDDADADRSDGESE